MENAHAHSVFSLSFSFWFMSVPQWWRFRIGAQQWRREVRFSV